MQWNIESFTNYLAKQNPALEPPLWIFQSRFRRIYTFLNTYKKGDPKAAFSDIKRQAINRPKRVHCGTYASTRHPHPSDPEPRSSAGHGIHVQDAAS